MAARVSQAPTPSQRLRPRVRRGSTWTWLVVPAVLAAGGFLIKAAVNFAGLSRSSRSPAVHRCAAEGTTELLELPINVRIGQYDNIDLVVDSLNGKSFGKWESIQVLPDPFSKFKDRVMLKGITFNKKELAKLNETELGQQVKAHLKNVCTPVWVTLGLGKVRYRSRKQAERAVKAFHGSLFANQTVWAVRDATVDFSQTVKIFGLPTGVQTKWLGGFVRTTAGDGVEFIGAPSDWQLMESEKPKLELPVDVQLGPNAISAQDICDKLKSKSFRLCADAVLTTNGTAKDQVVFKGMTFSRGEIMYMRPANVINQVKQHLSQVCKDVAWVKVGVASIMYDLVNFAEDGVKALDGATYKGRTLWAFYNTTKPDSTTVKLYGVQSSFGPEEVQELLKSTGAGRGVRKIEAPNQPAPPKAPKVSSS